MARRPDDKPRPRRDHRGGGGGGGRNANQARSVTISKALSKLLRHQAQNERVPISAEGWCRVSDVLAWRGLGRAVGRGEEVTLEEVAGVVGENDKKRLALRWTNDPSHVEGQGDGDKEISLEGLTIEQQPTETTEMMREEGTGEGEGEDTATERAIKAILSTADTDPAHYLIRAVQGHSMRSIGTDDLLTSITLSTLSSITSDGLVVHGTFYGAWRGILDSGGLKRMGRNHVHFATGPGTREVLHVPSDGDDGKGEVSGEVGRKLEQNKVISGMRRDAQILIYVNVRRALEEVPGMEWWRSENGVILTEGVEMAGEDTVDGQVGDEQDEAGGSKSKSKGKGEVVKIVPMSCWEVVVEVKQGHGVIWRRGEGVVKELPDAFLERGMPPGKGRGGGRRGRGR